jgi:preprotein translocase subunit SecD
MRDVTRENIGKRMAILLFEKGKGEVVTAPVIRAELGNRFQISGRMTTVEAADQALLLRAGSLAAPMEIIEEKTIGPSLGAENIDKGFDSVTYGFDRDRSLHVRLLPAVRRVLDAGAGPSTCCCWWRCCRCCRPR